MVSTADWTKSLNVSIEPVPAEEEEYEERYPRTAREIALRAIVLQGVVAVAGQVAPDMITEWFEEQEIWQAVSPREREFLLADSRTYKQCNQFSWQVEAEWTLLWMIGKVEALGLPDHQCDTRQLMEEIIPQLYSDIEGFVSSAELRRPGVLLAEDLRTYDLWCYALRDRRENRPFPSDLDLNVLYWRRYAFEWLDSTLSWDEIVCDA